jgi:hypothetical protein
MMWYIIMYIYIIELLIINVDATLFDWHEQLSWNGCPFRFLTFPCYPRLWPAIQCLPTLNCSQLQWRLEPCWAWIIFIYFPISKADVLWMYTTYTNISILDILSNEHFLNGECGYIMIWVIWAWYEPIKDIDIIQFHFTPLRSRRSQV